jgi:hypothetical protein
MGIVTGMVALPNYSWDAEASRSRRDNVTTPAKATR